MEGRLWTTVVMSVRRRTAQVQHTWSSATRGSGHKADKYGKELVSQMTNTERNSRFTEIEALEQTS